MKTKSRDRQMGLQISQAVQKADPMERFESTNPHRGLGSHTTFLFMTVGGILAHIFLWSRRNHHPRSAQVTIEVDGCTTNQKSVTCKQAATLYCQKEFT
eukprot:591834-Amphidinium_carterae.1